MPRDSVCCRITGKDDNATCFQSIFEIRKATKSDETGGTRIRLLTDEGDIDKFLGAEIISTRTGCEVFPLEVLKNIKEVSLI